VNERVVVRLLSANQGNGPTVRARQAAQTLRNQWPIGVVNIRRAGRGYQVMADGALFVAVTRAEARAHGSNPRTLAVGWASRLRAAVAVPPLTVADTWIRVPVGETRSLSVGGSLARFAESGSDNGEVARARLEGNSLRIQGISTGDATITVQAGSHTRTVRVDVRPFAASFPQYLSASVIGSPTAASMVQGAIESAIRQQFKALPEANFSWNLRPTSALGLGNAQTYVVPVTVKAPGAIERTGSVHVTVRNLGVGRDSDAELWYCNYPENVKFPQHLFSARLKRTAPARMLYHHINDSSQPMVIRVQVVNDSDQPARIGVIPGDSAPDKNPVLAGIQAAEQYVRSYLWWSGEAIDLPPNSSFSVSFRRIGPQETMSGLCSLRILAGPDSVLVRTDAIPAFAAEGKWAAAQRSSTPWREIGIQPASELDRTRFPLSQHVYPNPYKRDEVANYRVGDRHAFVRVGERAIARQDNESVLSGNFGVFYTVRAEIENPTNEAAVVDVSFIPSAGYSGGLFVVNGNLVRSPLLQAQSSWRITRLRLDPGQRRSINLTTVPLSGSSYPITLQIGATGAVAATSLR
jgi:hypothetical protein